MITLDTLPADIQYNILSWLICPLVGHDIARQPQTLAELMKADLVKLKAPKYAQTNRLTGNHPYLCLAASNRDLRASIEDYCHHLVMKRLQVAAKRIVKPKYINWSVDVARAKTKGKGVATIETRTYRLQYLKWAQECCLFCGKKSTRRAIFNLQMWCCKSCDEKEWGSMISKSTAKSRHKLSELHFNYPHLLWPDAYSAPLEYAFANLPVYQGALMLRDDDLARLAKHLQSHPLSLAQTRKLKGQLNAAAKQMQLIQGISHDRALISQMSALLRRFEDDGADHSDFTLPLSQQVCSQINYLLWTCQTLAREQARADANCILVAYKRVTAWWFHLLPVALVEHFEERTTYDSEGQRAYQLLARIDTPDGLQMKPNATYWIPVASWSPPAPL